ncbi:hypothetical protein [Streptosporangium sp. NPDC048865]|uniref:hypothetical protein n=1 Tax=Streptosporangium sp. NPDC048865 TaxID=3155766 RepID=UPI003442E4E7
MPKFKSVIAGLAISTALTGGVVGMGAATTVTSANAMTTAITSAAYPTWGGGCGWRRGCGRCCGGHRHHRRSHHRFRLIINNHNNNDNFLRNDNRSDRLRPLTLGGDDE